MQDLGEVGEQVELRFSKGPGLATLLMMVHSRATSSYQTGGGDGLPVTQALPYPSNQGVSQQHPCLDGDG